MTAKLFMLCFASLQREARTCARACKRLCVQVSVSEEGGVHDLVRSGGDRLAFIHCGLQSRVLVIILVFAD